ncbi:MAG: MerR family transcriptional regulator, partial [Acidobacteria bacterium]|nr:MerR family transcriptional regulator [Acidobacteriota bacterium]
MAVIRKKLFYKIGDVCKLCSIQPHVLRYWETEFTLLSPAKN